MKAECKRHRWRVGAKTAGFNSDGKIVVSHLNIWCEKCDKKIKAKYSSSVRLPWSGKNTIKKAKIKWWK